MALINYFPLHVCTDMGVEGKLNLEIRFEARPESVAHLAATVENVFQKESRGGAGVFAVDFIVFYDDDARAWKPLESVQQLENFTQLYLFQKGREQEEIRAIPRPMQTRDVPLVVGAKLRQIYRPGSSMMDKEKVENVYHLIDINGNGIEEEEMIHAFQVSGIEFNVDTVKTIFRKGDVDGDGYISPKEFFAFAELFPNTLETLYWRLTQVEADAERSPLGSAAARLKLHRQREFTLRRELEQLARERRALEEEVQQQRAVDRQVDPRRGRLEDEEQDLINKEFAVQFHRDLVCQAEYQFSQTAERFDKVAMGKGSPRRAYRDG